MDSPNNNKPSHISKVALSAYTPHSYVDVEDRKGWIKYGVANDFPDYLIDLYESSPTHGALVNSLSYYIYGAGFAPSALDQYKFNKTLLKSLVEYKIHGYFFLEIVFAGDQVKEILHIPTQLVRCGKRVGRDVPYYWYSEDWNDSRKKPVRMVSFNPQLATDHPNQILAVRPFSPGSFYYPKPDYIGAIEYIELEKRIGTFHVSAIKNGLAPSYIIKLKNGEPAPEERMRIENDIMRQMAGESNAGNVMIFYTNQGEEAPDVDTVQLSDADKQYQFLSGESAEKIMIGHRVVSPMLFGLKSNTGLGSNADELRQADELMRQNVVDPVRDMMLDHLEPLFKAVGVTQITWLDRQKSPTTEVVQPQQTTQPTAPNLSLCMGKHDNESDIDAMVKYLEDRGEEPDPDEWELIDIRPEDYDNDIEGALRLASVPSSNPNGISEQDNELFKVRYTYAPKVTDSVGPSRSFCRKMTASNKVYRKEDIIAASDRAVNPGFGIGGASTYDLWRFKGGPNCFHFWERRVYLRRNNKKITVTEARKMISALAPSKRDDVRLPQNDSDVARRPIDMPNNGYYKPRG